MRPLNYNEHMYFNSSALCIIFMFFFSASVSYNYFYFITKSSVGYVVISEKVTLTLPKT